MYDFVYLEFCFNMRFNANDPNLIGWVHFIWFPILFGFEIFITKFLFFSVKFENKCGDFIYCIVLCMLCIWYIICGMWTGTTHKQCFWRNRRCDWPMQLVFISRWSKTNVPNNFNQFARARCSSMLRMLFMLSRCF